LQGKGCLSSSYYGEIFTLELQGFVVILTPQAANVCFKLKLLHMDCRLVIAMKTAMLPKLQVHYLHGYGFIKRTLQEKATILDHRFSKTYTVRRRELINHAVVTSVTS